MTKQIDNKVREKIAKFLYEHHHPRIFWTFEQLEEEYPASADGIKQEADQILSLIQPLIEQATRELREELRIGNTLTAKLTDQCRELELRLGEMLATNTWQEYFNNEH